MKMTVPVGTKSMQKGMQTLGELMSEHNIAPISGGGLSLYTTSTANNALNYVEPQQG
jgi:hypothetical protein